MPNLDPTTEYDIWFKYVEVDRMLSLLVYQDEYIGWSTCSAHSALEKLSDAMLLRSSSEGWEALFEQAHAELDGTEEEPSRLDVRLTGPELVSLLGAILLGEQRLPASYIADWSVQSAKARIELTISSKLDIHLPLALTRDQFADIMDAAMTTTNKEAQ